MKEEFFLDSNIIIYAIKPASVDLRNFIEEKSPKISFITVIEVLEYQNLTEEETSVINSFFNSTEVYMVSNSIISHAIGLRKRRKISIPDSIIAATAIANNLTLITHNLADFNWIGELKIIDPVV